MTETVGRAIRRLRVEAGHTLRGFAGMVGISAAYQSDIEHDRRVPTDEVLRKAAGVLARRVDTNYESLRKLSARLESDLHEMVQQNPEVNQLLRQVKQSGRPAREVLRELQQHLRDSQTEDNKE